MVFKAIRENRPYPASGMTSKSWLGVPVGVLAVRSLIATQNHLRIDCLRADYMGSYSGDPVAHVIKWQGEFYLEDGHHRVIREALAGSALVNVRILDLDARAGEPVSRVPADVYAHLRKSADVPPGLVMVRGKGYRSPAIARALSGSHRVDWHDWSPGTEEHHKPVQYKDAS